MPLCKIGFHNVTQDLYTFNRVKTLVTPLKCHSSDGMENEPHNFSGTKDYDNKLCPC